MYLTIIFLCNNIKYKMYGKTKLVTNIKEAPHKMQLEEGKISRIKRSEYTREEYKRTGWKKCN